ncbi:MAG: flavodoxin [Bacteroidetes bacterium]|nr:flavodoxin [Bacteroidota bacterium]
MSKIALCYSFNTNKTSLAAKKIAEAFGKDRVELINAEDITPEKFLSYTEYIMGVPTWFDGELPNYWDEFIPALEDLDLKGRKFALFGNGDQKGYPENFVDGIGIMAAVLEKCGGTLIGTTSVDGYSFERSKACRGDKFAGLALDFENQGKLINQKITDWVDQLKKEFQVQLQEPRAKNKEQRQKNKDKRYKK